VSAFRAVARYWGMTNVTLLALAGAIASAGVLGCGRGSTTPLASLQGGTLVIVRWSSENWLCINRHTNCDTLEIGILPPDKSICPILSDETVATLGHHILQGSLGRLDHGVSDTACFGPSFRLDQVGSVLDINESVSTFTLSDGSATVRFSAQNLFALRKLQVISPANPDNLFHSGEVVTLQWSPPTDTLRESGNEMQFILNRGSPYEFHAPKRVERQGSTVTFDVPTDVFGEGHFEMYQPATPSILECSGPLSCQAEVGQDFSLPATIVP